MNREGETPIFKHCSLKLFPCKSFFPFLIGQPPCSRQSKKCAISCFKMLKNSLPLFKEVREKMILLFATSAKAKAHLSESFHSNWTSSRFHRCSREDAASWASALEIMRLEKVHLVGIEPTPRSYQDEPFIRGLALPWATGVKCLFQPKSFFSQALINLLFQPWLLFKNFWTINWIGPCGSDPLFHLLVAWKQNLLKEVKDFFHSSIVEI